MQRASLKNQVLRYSLAVWGCEGFDQRKLGIFEHSCYVLLREYAGVAMHRSEPFMDDVARHALLGKHIKGNKASPLQHAKDFSEITARNKER